MSFLITILKWKYKLEIQRYQKIWAISVIENVFLVLKFLIKRKYQLSKNMYQ